MKYRRGILALRRFEPPHEGLIFRDQAGSARHNFSLGRTDALQAGARRIHFSEPERVRTTEALLGSIDFVLNSRLDNGMGLFFWVLAAQGRVIGTQDRVLGAPGGVLGEFH